jgi:[NiFe] hydrogenase diaphorase moiety large subunit
MGRCRGVCAPGFVSMDSTPTRMDTMSSESLQSLIARHQASPHALVQILREAQTLQGWLPREYLVEIAGALGLDAGPCAGVSPVSTGSSTPAPVGTYRILFSDNITDRMLGNEALLRDLCARLGVTRGQVRSGWAGQHRAGLLHRFVRSGAGAAGQPPPDRDPIRCPGRIEHIAALIEAQVPPAQWPPEWSRVDDQMRD